MGAAIWALPKRRPFPTSSAFAHVRVILATIWASRAFMLAAVDAHGRALGLAAPELLSGSEVVAVVNMRGGATYLAAPWG